MMRAHDIAAKAAELVGGDRAKTHGSKLENHANIARLWTAYGRNAGWLTGDLSPLDVANLMELLKVARRQAGAHNPDDYVDGAGYAAVAGEIADTLEMRRAAVSASARVEPAEQQRHGATTTTVKLSAAEAERQRQEWVKGLFAPAPIDCGADAPGEGLVAEKPEDWVVRSTVDGRWRTALLAGALYTRDPALAQRMPRAEAQRIASACEYLVAEPASTLPAAKPAA